MKLAIMHLCRRKYIFSALFGLGAFFIVYQLYFITQMDKLSRDKAASDVKQLFPTNKFVQEVFHSFRVDYPSSAEALTWNSSFSELCHYIVKKHGYQFQVTECDSLVPGVLDRYQLFYVTFFKCLHSGEVIPFSYVNDNYCDCADFSDEPSTSACSDGRFFCTFQFDQANPVSVSSSRVNDGICDCCDGSDESKMASSFYHLELLDTNSSKINVVPCQNTCPSKLKRKV